MISPSMSSTRSSVPRIPASPIRWYSSRVKRRLTISPIIRLWYLPREKGSGKEDSVAKSVITPERFAKGRMFDEYVKYAGSPENLAREAFGSYYADGGSIGRARSDNSAVLRERYARTRVSDQQAAAIKWLAAQPNGPAKILVVSEDWSSDCRRDVPALARLAEAGGLELRIFNRDGQKFGRSNKPTLAEAPDSNADLMAEFLNEKDGQTFPSIPVAVFYDKDLRELYRYIEFPACYHKDRIRGHQTTARPGETPEETQARARKDFAAMLASPMLDVWSSAAFDEILSLLYERVTVGSLAK